MNAAEPRGRRHALLARHYEACLARHGDSHLGVDWPDAEGAARRYDVMLGVLGDVGAPASLLDIGCGAAHLLEHMRRRGLAHIAYRGLDISPAFVALCRRKHPQVTFLLGDLLAGGMQVAPADYVVMNGLFTEKRELAQAEMLGFLESMLAAAFPLARRGLAFNVMSKQVDRERDDLFHLPLDTMADIVARRLSRHFVVRQDYGLREYTVYVRREPWHPPAGPG